MKNARPHKVSILYYSCSLKHKAQNTIYKQNTIIKNTNAPISGCFFYARITSFFISPHSRIVSFANSKVLSSSSRKLVVVVCCICVLFGFCSLCFVLLEWNCKPFAKQFKLEPKEH